MAMPDGNLKTKTSDSEVDLFGMQTLHLEIVQTILVLNILFCGSKLFFVGLEVHGAQNQRS